MSFGRLGACVHRHGAHGRTTVARRAHRNAPVEGAHAKCEDEGEARAEDAQPRCDEEGVLVAWEAEALAPLHVHAERRRVWRHMGLVHGGGHAHGDSKGGGGPVSE